MSKLTSVAFIGSGYIGSFILSALAAQASPPSTLIVLSRNPESKKLPPGVKAIKVDDYGDVDSVTKILVKYKIDAVVSTVSPAPAAIQAQKQMADAAKKAGVKLFVPSEFGSPTDDAPDDYPPFQEKDKVASEHLPIFTCARFYVSLSL
jgi:saccharopine dehydrogenase-like NADP-dependent oxidoreductase